VPAARTAPEKAAVQEPGIISADFLTDLGRSRKALGGLGEKVSRAFDIIDAAVAMVERNRGAVTSLCELARSSAEQQIVLALKLADVTCSGHTGPDEPALLAIEQIVDKCGASTLAYFDGKCNQASPAAGAGPPDTPTDSHSKEQPL
jgi:hypothetical protein